MGTFSVASNRRGRGKKAAVDRRRRRQQQLAGGDEAAGNSKSSCGIGRRKNSGWGMCWSTGTTLTTTTGAEEREQGADHPQATGKTFRSPEKKESAALLGFLFEVAYMKKETSGRSFKTQYMHKF